MSAIPVPRTLPPTLAGPLQGFRENTNLTTTPFNFVFNDEGMGGFINYTGATTWMAKHCPWLHGRVWVEQFLVPLFTDIHAPFKHWKVLPHNQFQRLVEHGTPTIGPMISHGGIQAKREFLTAIGTHPFDVGFGYFASTCPAPKDAYLPVLDYSRSMLPAKVKRAGEYVVITCGGTTPVRTMTGQHINPLIEHVKSMGFTPVFLGKRDMLTDGRVNTQFADDTNYDAGVDMRDQTTVKDAACIMQHAKCTVGIDGGLLHLAALMRDSRLVFGYNITSVEHREPRRNHGRHVNVALTREELSCTACQSTWKNRHLHLYDRCEYGDTKCLELLFANNSLKFKNAIDEVLSA